MNGSLFITTEAPDSPFQDLQAVKRLLIENRLIEASDSNPYLCGEGFASQIIFMGCSPYLQFEPPADGSDDYCHVLLHQFQTPRLFTGQQTAPPRCPSCRYRIGDWKTSLDLTTDDWHCPKCGTDTSLFELDWKQSGGAGCLLIEIRNIFPGEAVPVDTLMHELARISHEKWRYFYTAS